MVERKIIVAQMEWVFIDKSEWGPGPWHTEPDKIQWQHEGRACLIVRNASGALCGYAGVTEGHPFFGVEYDKGTTGKNSDHWDHSPEAQLDVHGGITFSDYCNPHEGDRGICHVLEDEEKTYWFGFDCGHVQDLMPTHKHLSDAVYRDVPYVRDQVQRLAEQLNRIDRERR